MLLLSCAGPLVGSYRANWSSAKAATDKLKGTGSLQRRKSAERRCSSVTVVYRLLFRLPVMLFEHPDQESPDVAQTGGCKHDRRRGYTRQSFQMMCKQ